MTPTISLAQHTVPLWTPSEMLENAAKIGYNAVSIRAVAQGIANEAVFSLSDKSIYSAAKDRIRDTGVFINDIDLVSIHEQRDIHALEREFEAAASLGVRGVISSVWTDERALAEDRFSALCALAKVYQLTVHLEFVTWSAIRTVLEAAAFLQKVSADNARILLDTIHFYRSRCAISDLHVCDPQLFELVHLCDAPAAIPAARETLISSCRRERLYPGEGAIPIAEILDALPCAKVFSVEIPNSHSTEIYGAYGHAERALQSVRCLFDAGA